MSLRTPLGRVLGLGSAHDGVRHWTVQRITAVALVPLALWFVLSIGGLPLADYAVVTGWVARGWNPVLLTLFVLTVAWHSQLGVQVVIEDYVHASGAKAVGLLVNIFAHVLIAAVGVFAVVRLAARSHG